VHHPNFSSSLNYRRSLDKRLKKFESTVTVDDVSMLDVVVQFDRRQ
jgi:hypothetical protein